MSCDSESSETQSQDPVQLKMADEIGFDSEQEVEAEISQPTPPATQTDDPLIGYELVADMMRRQDEVIAELDSLNERIESAIKEISDARKLEEQAENPTEQSETGEPLRAAA